MSCSTQPLPPRTLNVLLHSTFLPTHGLHFYPISANSKWALIKTLCIKSLSYRPSMRDFAPLCLLLPPARQQFQRAVEVTHNHIDVFLRCIRLWAHGWMTLPQTPKAPIYPKLSSKLHFASTYEIQCERCYIYIYTVNIQVDAVFSGSWLDPRNKTAAT